MNKYTIQFSKDAKEDLKQIVNYIKNNLQEPNIARKLSDKIKEKIYTLSDSPKVFSIINEDFIRKLEIRKIIVDNYIIFYRVIDEEKKVQIVRIMYGRRNWINLL